MAPETLDTIVDFLANGDFCAQNGDERCPAAVDGVIRQGDDDDDDDQRDQAGPSNDPMIP